jgi:hypothetical protein
MASNNNSALDLSAIARKAVATRKSREALALAMTGLIDAGESAVGVKAATVALVDMMTAQKVRAFTFANLLVIKVKGGVEVVEMGEDESVINL